MGCGSSAQTSDTNNNEGKPDSQTKQKQQQQSNQQQKQQQKPVQNGVTRGGDATGGGGQSKQTKSGGRAAPSNQQGRSGQDEARDLGPELTQEPETEEVDVPKAESGYPSPKPPKDKRDDIFHASKMKKIDHHARNTPPEKADDFKTLVSYLTSPCRTDVEKVRAIYIWLGHQSGGGGSGDIDTPRGFMQLVHDQRASYAALYAVLCRHAGIPCVIIDGFAKTAEYNVGDNEEKMRTLQNRWNAVYVADGWRPVVTRWACVDLDGPSNAPPPTTHVDPKGKQGRTNAVNEVHHESPPEAKTLNEYFFLTDPEELVHVALPKDPRWQLVARPWSMQKFLEIPHCRQFYFTEKVGIEGKFSSTLRAKEGVCTVQLTCERPLGMSVDYELEYNADESGRSIPSSLQLNNYAMMTRTNTDWEIVMRFPEVGIYKLNVIGGRGYESNLCSFKIIVQEVHEDVHPFPLNPGCVGFGPSADTERAGIKAMSHKTGIVKVTARNNVHMNFTLLKNLTVRTELFSNKMAKEELAKYLVQTQSDRSLNLQVQVPVHGEYALTMHAQPKEGSGYSGNVCNYLLTTDDGRRKRLRAWENPTEKQTRLSVQHMAKTKGTRDIEALEKELTRFDKMALEDKGDYTAGHDALEYKKLKKELEDAVKRRHLETLEKAIEHGTKSRFRDRVQKQLMEAEQVRDHLKHLNKISHDVLEMKQPTISELRSYKIPPQIVEDIMRSTFLLLGEKEVWLQDWEDLQVLMGKTGKDAMLRRVRQFDTVNVKPEARKHVEKTLNDHTELEARLASAGAGTFYVWLRDVCQAMGSPDSGGGQTEQAEHTNDEITNGQY